MSCDSKLCSDRLKLNFEKCIILKILDRAVDQTTIANKAEFVGAFFSAMKILAGKQRKRKNIKREPEKERENNRKRKETGRHFGVSNAISLLFENRA